MSDCSTCVNFGFDGYSTRCYECSQYWSDLYQSRDTPSCLTCRFAKYKDVDSKCVVKDCIDESKWELRNDQSQG